MRSLGLSRLYGMLQCGRGVSDLRAVGAEQGCAVFAHGGQYARQPGLRVEMVVVGSYVPAATCRVCLAGVCLTPNAGSGHLTA
jgi:hypothetical protein